MIYLTLEELLYVADRAMGEPPQVRDLGLLQSAASRPSTSFGGVDAYHSLLEKAAALTHSLVNNHALVDGNKRLGLAGLIAFLGMNGMQLTATNDEAYALIVNIADGSMDVSEIVSRLSELVG